ncbi:undecaprenyldiphospho-muramoylpentapeptide beta-N-acetylglucosaminyltransferase [Acinetobacter qingfengensis]|uniref:UDP-N-acetylglucosamine--N-acetylmuramyl-(pentapeptide) pyrophosphoryl-undecaprenol N-acetylglucosamine transferase n=2 Tax=Acinetobacter qingfengensis TaxID=1262585 RepID=A0A1E7QWK5_9GAMM|nr:undecaprenyldiphospho-muramoylpentapeptide beta-N-acetylglucosaminyltransferase [Acinetobacter qingfengensis]OEY91470.1 undecaprenyldiphospho-muramoylpentapeptide beta-N-acetylglucosaminyltransferase [Acinetobacter qingfengensis]
MMAAGTGGHVFPALAVAKELQRRGHQVSWLATPSGMENRLLQQYDIPIYQIDIQGVRGNGVIRKLLAPFKILKAMLAAMQIMKAQKIDAVVGFGGYVAGPGGLAARLSGIPVLIHEQNAVAGFTNKQLARIAKTICQAFPKTFPETKNLVTTGNPVRQEICETLSPKWRYEQRETAQQPLKILIVGGSLGAQALNERIPTALAALNLPIQVYHQCGQQQLDATQQRYRDAKKVDGFTVEVVPFIENMAQAYSDADLIICRAGALTVTEVATAGLAAIFIPLPSAVDDHQTANAHYLADVGAAKICPQETLISIHLTELLIPLMSRNVLSDMAIKARQQAQTQATAHVADLVEAL